MYVSLSHGDVSAVLNITLFQIFFCPQATGEFSIEALPSSNPHAKLFSINPMKSSVDAGGNKTINITFSLPKDTSTHTIEANTNVSSDSQYLHAYQLYFNKIDV